MLEALEILQRDAVLLQGGANSGLELKIENVVPHRAAQQKLDRQEADPLGTFLTIPVPGIEPALHQDLTNLARQREEPVPIRRFVEPLGALHREMLEHPLGDLIGGHVGRIVVERLLRADRGSHAGSRPWNETWRTRFLRGTGTAHREAVRASRTIRPSSP